MGCHSSSLKKLFSSIGVFALLNAVAVLKYMQSVMSRAEFRHFFIVAAGSAAGVVFLAVVGLTWMGVIAPWSGRFALNFFELMTFYLKKRSR